MLNIDLDWASYPDENGQISCLKILENIHLSLCFGDVLWISGTTGCGKTTLLKIISGIIPNYETCAYEGQILLNGNPLNLEEISQNISFCFQTAEHQFLFDNVKRQFFIKKGDYKEYSQVESTFQRIGKAHLFNKSIKDISSGERKVVAILSTLNKKKRVQIFDEPTANLDNQMITSVFELIKSNSSEHITIIVSHDPSVARICNKILHFDEVNKKWLYGDNNLVTEITQKLKKLIFIDHNKKLINNEEIIIECESLGYEYPDGTVAYQNISCAIERGNIIGVLGKNGTGKTTFIKTLIGGISPSSGRVTSKIKKYGVVLQEYEKQMFGFSVWDEILFGIKKDFESKTEATQMLQKINLLPYKNFPPFFLSGGQKQLLLIGSVLMHHPELIILDEPFSNLDTGTIYEIMNLLLHFQRKYFLTIVITDQDDTLIKYIIDKSVTLE